MEHSPGPTDPLRVGVLTPHRAPGPETEFPDLASGRVTVRVARLDPAATAAELRKSARPEAVDRSAGTFRGHALDAVAYASTSTGYALGHRAEVALVDRLVELCQVPVVSSTAAAIRVLRSGRTERVTLVHPPWFEAELDGLGVAYFRDQGFDAAVIRATGLPGDPARIRTDLVVAELGPVLSDGEGPVFLAGNGFRAAAAVEPLERLTGRLILQSNQVTLFSILAATRPDWKITGYGQLFG